MSIKIDNINFTAISNHNILRSDFKFFSWIKEIKELYPKSIKLKYMLEYYYKGFAFKGEDFSSFGDIMVLKGINITDEHAINYNTIEYLPSDFWLDKKYQKFIVKKDEIIITLVGSIGKVALITTDSKTMLNQNNIAIKLKEQYIPKVYCYILAIIIDELVSKLYKSSGYSFLRIEDLFRLDIPLLSYKQQKEILSEIEESEITNNGLKANLKDCQEIIDEIIANEFKFDLNKIKQVDTIKYLNSDINTYSNNSNLRFSFRWNKLKQLQNEMFSKLHCTTNLGKYIITTRNGWSPECSEDLIGYKVLGIDAISKRTILNLDNPKYTDLTKNNIDDYIIKDNDFFVSRGNTTDLVALASIAHINDDDQYIYPDLMIKITLNENYINKQYLAYVFNSFIGRIYFKYVSKGKNQTMVKISAKELYDFLIPIPEIKEQEKIVELIKKELDKQELIQHQIKEKRNEIEKNILHTMKES